MYKKIVIERTRDLIYLKFVETEFSQKIISPRAGKIPVTQRSPCYSAVSVLLINPLPDRSNYSPLCHTHYLTLDQYFTRLFRPDPLPSRELETKDLKFHYILFHQWCIFFFLFHTMTSFLNNAFCKLFL